MDNTHSPLITRVDSFFVPGRLMFEKPGITDICCSLIDTGALPVFGSTCPLTGNTNVYDVFPLRHLVSVFYMTWIQNYPLTDRRILVSVISSSIVFSSPTVPSSCNLILQPVNWSNFINMGLIGCFTTLFSLTVRFSHPRRLILKVNWDGPP